MSDLDYFGRKISKSNTVELNDVVIDKKINVEELLSVKDDSSPVTADYIIHVGKEVITAFPSGIQLENIMEAVVLIMETTTKLYNLNAENKIDFICDVLCYVVDNTDAGALEALDPIIKKMIPSVVNTIIGIENDNLKINSHKCSSLACLPCFH